MNFLGFKKSAFRQLTALMQVFILVAYFSLNIMNVGEMGTGLLLLVGFFVLSGIILVMDLFQYKTGLHAHFFIFFIFVVWLAFRVIVDLNDFEYLKQITIATTGGVLLFCLIGTFVRQALVEVIFSKNKTSLKILIFLFFLMNFLIFLAFKERFSEGDGVFLIEGVNEGYQRPGNFIVMLFIMSSLLCFSIIAQANGKSKIKLFFWLSIYSLNLFLNLINSQMMGSNAATANVLAIYLLTLVSSLLVFNKTIRKKYLSGQAIFPFSREVNINILKYTLLTVSAICIIVTAFLQFSDFDLGKTRVFGFGSGENTSVNSRWEILKETGSEQMGFSPIFGNVDVARLTTGETGRTLHNFMPNVLAELGLIGVLIVTLLFIMITRILLSEMRASARDDAGFIRSSIGFWKFLIFIFLFLYANISVGKEWPVIWFFIGFASSAFMKKLKNKKR